MNNAFGKAFSNIKKPSRQKKEIFFFPKVLPWNAILFHQGREVKGELSQIQPCKLLCTRTDKKTHKRDKIVHERLDVPS